MSFSLWKILAPFWCYAFCKRCWALTKSSISQSKANALRLRNKIGQVLGYYSGGCVACSPAFYDDLPDWSAGRTVSHLYANWNFRRWGELCHLRIFNRRGVNHLHSSQRNQPYANNRTPVRWRRQQARQICRAISYTDCAYELDFSFDSVLSALAITDVFAVLATLIIL